MKLIKQLNRLQETKEYLDNNYNTIIKPDNSYIADSKILTNNRHLEYVSTQGWRSTNEDEFLYALDDKNILLAVFDGHGGDWVSNYCSKMYANILFETEAYKEQNYVEAFKEANKIMDLKIFKETNDDMYNYASSDLTRKLFKYRQEMAHLNRSYFHHSDKCGCTCCAVLITPNQIICSNIGDSKAIVMHSDRSYNILNREHKLTLDEEYERVMESRHGVLNNRVGGVLNLTRCFGDFEFKELAGDAYNSAIISEPEISITERMPNNDWIIIGCDGLWDCFNESDVTNFIFDSRSIFMNSKSRLDTSINMKINKIDDYRDLMITNTTSLITNLARNCVSDGITPSDFSWGYDNVTILGLQC